MAVVSAVARTVALTATRAVEKSLKGLSGRGGLSLPFIDISVLGDKELARALAKLPDKYERKAVRPALRASAKRLKVRVVQAYSGIIIGVRTGRTLAGFIAHRVKALPRKGGWIGAAFDFPTREELG
ncbi:hypothetical protein LCGC14_2057850, partial [marine sediment metagenome]